MNMQKPEAPSTSPKGATADIIADLKLISEVFEIIENETAEVAEMLFDILINATDEQIMSGTIPGHKNPKIAAYLKILNRLFLFSRKHSKDGGMRIINRKTVQELDKKTFTICMCFDGGVSLDILCDVVNTENQARTPSRSPVKITIKQAFGSEHQHGR